MPTPENEISNPEQTSLGNEVLADSMTKPYTRNEREMHELLRETVANTSLLYIDSATNPEIGNFSIYKLEGTSGQADLGRTIEADVFKEYAGYPPEFIEENFSAYDSNSIFLLMVDQNDKDCPKIAGALRIIDCTKGESETIDFFYECFGENAVLPPELTVGDNAERGLWDIMTIVMYPEYRDGVKSAWLYHALYRLSTEEGVDNWIANITPKETKILRQLFGIPFQEIPGVEPVVEPSPVIEGEKSVYGFYSLEVNNMFPAVWSNIIAREELGSATQKRMANLARIGLFGYTSKQT